VSLAVLALDYDGTITLGDGLDPAMRHAIAAARRAGIVVLLVTGRILDELRRVAGELYFVDGVVAENGAVVHFPERGYTSSLAPAVLPQFVTELGKHQITFLAGQCLVDAAAADAPILLETIRQLELPLVLLFNRSRVMTLPQGVSKATGLRATLDILRLSPRNMVAIGDAENDHEMLRLAEVGAAVGWGSPTLRAAADVIVDGHGPADVARFVEGLAAAGRLPTPQRARRRLLLGHTEDGHELSLAVRGRNVLVAGDARSGKSWIAGLLCEQLILHGYCVCVLDPEGDYKSLESLPGMSVLGGDDPAPRPRELVRALRYPDRSVVIDLSRLDHDEKIQYIRAALRALKEMRRRTGLPHRILVDEAHYFLHEDDAPDLLDLERNGYIFVTYRASHLPREVLAAAEVMLVTCESDPAEVEALRLACANCQHVDGTAWHQLLGRLTVGQAIVLPITEEAGGEVRLFNLGNRLTPHVRHREKYVDVPVSEHHAFVFAVGGDGPDRRARTLRDLVMELDTLPAGTLDGHLRRHDFSRWIREVFGDYALADDLERQEDRYVAGVHIDVVSEIATAVRARYDLTSESDETNARVGDDTRT
jgi:hydroxymethylpyrimidine pyrophosphatase-like HAD family hydrolase